MAKHRTVTASRKSTTAPKRLRKLDTVEGKRAAIAAEMAERMRKPVILGNNGRVHPFACTTCQRVPLRWENRRCKLCVQAERLWGLDKLPHEASAKHSVATRPMSSLSPARQAIVDYESAHSPTVAGFHAGALLQSTAPSADAADHVADGVGGYNLAEHIHVVIDDLTWQMVDLRTAGKTISDIAKLTNRDRKSVRERLQRFDKGEAGKPPGKRVHDFDVLCDYCGVKRVTCENIKGCCSDCHHPGLVSVYESMDQYLYRWETPINDIELEYWDSWPGRR